MTFMPSHTSLIKTEYLLAFDVDIIMDSILIIPQTDPIYSYFLQLCIAYAYVALSAC